MVVQELPLDQLKQTYLKPRHPDSHKGDFGHVTVIGGQPGMLGAVLLAGHAALNVGAGKVTLATDASHFQLVPIYRPELMSLSLEDSNHLLTHLKQSNMVIIGPGLGISDSSLSLLQWLADHYQGPLLVDADGLNVMANHAITFNNELILTPHPGEAARLLNQRVDEIQAHRNESVLQLAEQFNAVVVLKGHKSLIAYHQTIFQCPYGNPGMATAGMGDVLSGIIGSLVAQGVPIFEATQLGVGLHAQAGDQAVIHKGEHAMVASDVIEYL